MRRIDDNALIWGAEDMKTMHKGMTAKKLETVEVAHDDAPQSETRIRVRKSELATAMADALEDILRAEKNND